MLMTTPPVVSVDSAVNHQTHEGLKMNDGLVYSRTINSGLTATLCVQLRSSNPTVLRNVKINFCGQLLTYNTNSAGLV
jgi:hypothetical protein